MANTSTSRKAVQPVINRPSFSSINYSEIEPELDRLLANARQTIKDLCDNAPATWVGFMEPSDDLHDEISRFWSPVSHLNSVLNSDELRAAYTACLPKLSEFHTELGQNRALYEKTLAIREGPDFDSLDKAQRKTIENSLRDFKLSGVALPDEEKKRYMEISLRLSEIQNKFSENVLDTTNAWEKLVTDEMLLAGIPEHAKQAAKERAEKEDKKGWLLNLDFPTYYAISTFADDRELRREMYTAFSTRASDQGPHEILGLRVEMAELLGFASYAELSMARKMVEAPKQVFDFLNDLAGRALPVAKREMQELKDFAKNRDGLAELEAWDVGYYSDKLKQQQYAISEEDLKPYFPASRAIPGMFEVVGRLFGLKIARVENKDVWHKDVELYQIHDANDQLRGEFYMDNYARANKRGGAWMDVCVSRRRLDSERVQVPLAYLTCNLTPPVGDDPALLTHNEVTTLFHEFGHGLHHMLTLVDAPDVAGISGVEWDAVQPISGELVLGARGPRPDQRALPDRRENTPGFTRKSPAGQEFPVRDADGPAARIFPV